MANRFVYLVRHGEATTEGVLTAAGRRQAELLGARLADVPLSAIHHSPLPRAVETVGRLGLTDVPTAVDELVGDYVPFVPDPADLPPVFAEFLAGFTATELADGPPLATAAVERYARPGPADGDDVHELIVTHNFTVAWFVRDALRAPPERWLGLNHANASLTVIAYRPDRPPTLVVQNDLRHLPAELRWTGFPPAFHI